MSKYHLLVTAEATVEVEAETEEEAKEAAGNIVFANRYAWDYFQATIL